MTRIPKQTRARFAATRPERGVQPNPCSGNTTGARVLWALRAHSLPRSGVGED